MSLKITVGKETLTLTNVEEKALLTDMFSIEQWLLVVVKTKAKQCINACVEEVRANESLLSKEDARIVSNLISKDKSSLFSQITLSDTIKNEIVNRCKIKSGKERTEKLTP